MPAEWQVYKISSSPFFIFLWDACVTDHYTGLVVTTKEAYQEAIEFLYHHPEDRRRMGENAAAYARQMFGAEHAGRKLNDHYAKLLDQEKRRRNTFNPAHSGESLCVSSGTLSGAQLYADSLGAENNPFLLSLTANEDDVTLAADEAIQAMSPVPWPVSENKILTLLQRKNGLKVRTKVQGNVLFPV